ncbi:hypothetical protein E2C01_067569 [Portunus trituberculatus]|uniref:Uncharacterized protein n=1 Tax=Portunus trituberculatus TaxID=210409 RepID=A0A5B7HVE6_PORTR|nr:hypothetical protein [Portunus trituberculatus]
MGQIKENNRDRKKPDRRHGRGRLRAVRRRRHRYLKTHLNMSGKITAGKEKYMNLLFRYT